MLVLSPYRRLNLTFAHKALNRGKKVLGLVMPFMDFVFLLRSWCRTCTVCVQTSTQAPQVYMINEFVMEQEHKKLGLVQGDRFWTCYDTLYAAFKLSLSLSSESPP